MQVVHILGDDCHVVFLFQVGQHIMRMVGLHVHEILPPGVIKLQHRSRVFLEALHTGHFHRVEFFPQTVHVAESGYTALPADAGTCENHDILSFFHKRFRLLWMIRFIHFANTKIRFYC